MNSFLDGYSLFQLEYPWLRWSPFGGQSISILRFVRIDQVKGDTFIIIISSSSSSTYKVCIFYPYLGSMTNNVSFWVGNSRTSRKNNGIRNSELSSSISPFLSKNVSFGTTFCIIQFSNMLTWRSWAERKSGERQIGHWFLNSRALIMHDLQKECPQLMVAIYCEKGIEYFYNW